VPGHALGVGVDRERPEPRAERLVLGMGQVLVAQVDHLVAVERLLELLERLVRQVRQAHADHFGAHRRPTAARPDVLVRQRVVVVVARGVTRTSHMVDFLSQLDHCLGEAIRSPGVRKASFACSNGSARRSPARSC
jgi:hypothetical protein